MRMKKALSTLSRGTLLALLAIFSLSVTAKSINGQMARQKAESFMRKQLGFPVGVRMQGVKTALPTTVLPTRSAATGEANQPIYIFNCEGGGYVIVSGDDRTFEILGYSRTGRIDPATMPSNMKSWLCTYAEIINNLGNMDVPVQRTPMRAKKNIKPCLTTTWAQSEPYNRYTPRYTYTHNGETYSEHSVTGCAATAMAQVMYHYRYPNALQTDLSGYKGTLPVEAEDGTTVKATYTVESVAAGTPIDWENMLPSYKSYGDYTDANADAVARLMQYLGTAFMADYGDQTGTSASNQLEGTINAFGYKDAYFVFNDSYDTYEEWIDRVYEELEAAEVVAFGGQSMSFGGHAFVFDGYEDEDYFHVNWGWAGSMDGYYRLLPMNPFYIGDGFYINQYFIAGLGPNGKGYTKMERAFECKSFSLGEEGQIIEKSDDGYEMDLKLEFGNTNFPEFKAWLGLGVYDENEECQEVLLLMDAMLPVTHLTYYTASGNIPIPAQKEGTYIIKPVCSTVQPENGEVPAKDEWLPMYRADRTAVYITIENDVMTISYNAPDDDSDGINIPQAQHTDDIWRTLDGRMLPGKPIMPGIYINGGKKVLIK